jgi:outer membrane protein assembly factor BamE
MGIYQIQLESVMIARTQIVLGNINMRNMVILFFFLLTLSSCSYLQIHRMEIEQGNIITPEALSKVHTGMSEAEVKNIMGEPVLANVFDANRLTYVYTYKPGYGKTTEKSVTFIFKNGMLSNIENK